MRFELMLFSTETDRIIDAQAAGVDAILVDWERTGKHWRQRDADTEISRDTAEDLHRVRRLASRVVCRVNRPGDGDFREIDAAIDAGADELLIPMVRSASELQRILEHVGGRCAVGALIETEAAVANAEKIGSLPLARVYLGLNDLAIERGSRSIFAPLLDGTVERVRAAVSTRFGFGGLTLPERGDPVPCRLLLAEMVRLQCDFTFLRRSYKRDVPVGAQPEAVARMREALQRVAARDEFQVRRDRRKLAQLIPTIEGASAAAGRR